jgi:glycosyltransferase involved in cell wall biosynthesis
MACGCPVIATRSGSTPELIEHGVSGYLADTTHDIDPLIEDESLHKITPENCRKQAEKFSRKHMAEAYEKIYTEVLEGGF